MTRDDFPKTTNWQKIVAIIQVEFREETLAKACMWKTVVLIPKGKRDLRGIWLIEVLWKAVASRLNRRLTAVITYHDALNGFWVGRGTWTAAPKNKLLQ